MMSRCFFRSLDSLCLVFVCCALDLHTCFLIYLRFYFLLYFFFFSPAMYVFFAGMCMLCLSYPVRWHLRATYWYSSHGLIYASKLSNGLTAVSEKHLLPVTGFPLFSPRTKRGRPGSALSPVAIHLIYLVSPEPLHIFVRHPTLKFPDLRLRGARAARCGTARAR